MTTEYFAFKKMNNKGFAWTKAYKERASELVAVLENAVEHFGASRDLSLALTKVEESVMWYSKAISSIEECQEK